MITTVLPQQPPDVDVLVADLLEHLGEARWLAKDIAGDLQRQADLLMLASQQLERTLEQFISQSAAERTDPMAKVSEKFGSAYLKAEHLNGRPRIATIDGYDTEIIYGEEKDVLNFVGEKRRLPLSPTCAKDIAAALGLDEMEEWHGYSIELYPEQLTITDRETKAEKRITMIRARAPSSGSPATKLAPPPRPAPKSATTARRSDLDDDIPY